MRKSHHCRMLLTKVIINNVSHRTAHSTNLMPNLENKNEK